LTEDILMVPKSESENGKILTSVKIKIGKN